MDPLQPTGLELSCQVWLECSSRVNPSLQRDGLSKAQQDHREHSQNKDKQTEVSSWVPRPKTLRSKSCAYLGVLQNLNRMQTAELLLYRRRKQYFPNSSRVLLNIFKIPFLETLGCLPGTPLSSTGRHGPCHPHLSSGRHGGNRQCHRSRYV
jgi:hypothetical protein